jgi:hypothetical protein
VINSKAVCGDKLCNKADEIRAKKGIQTTDKEICGDEPCKYLHRAERAIPKNVNTPLGKYKFGIPLHQITCDKGLVLILKSLNNDPNCVKPENAQKLIASGWALDPQSQKIVIAQSQEEHSTKITMSKYNTDKLLIAGFNRIDGQEFVVFEGVGWHGYHNVEISISDQSGIVDSVRSKSTVHGRLWMPWPIPESLPPGQYHVHASDGIHQSKLTIQINEDRVVYFEPKN